MAQTLESTRINQQFAELREVIRNIFYELKSMNSNEQSRGYDAVMESLLKELPQSRYIDEKQENSSMSNEIVVSSLQDIDTNTANMAQALVYLTNSTANRSEKTDKYYDAIVRNTSDFLDLEEENTKKGGVKELFSSIIGNIKGSMFGFASRLFSPKPRTVVLAQSSIKDISGVLKSYRQMSAVTGEGKKENFKDKTKTAVSNDVAKSLGTIVLRVGTAIANGIKAISTALQVFIYVLFPLVLLGAVAIIVVGLYFIAKFIVEALSNIVMEVVRMFTNEIKDILAGYAEIISGIGTVINTIATGIQKVFDVFFGMFDTVKAIADAVLNFLNPASLASFAGTAVSGIKSLASSFLGNSKDDKELPDKFAAFTEPICRSVNDFADMVKGYLVAIAKAKPSETIRTNAAQFSNTVNHMELDGHNNSTSRSSEYNRQSSSYSTSSYIHGETYSNTSVAMDGRPDEKFNRTNIAKFENSYTNNTTSSSSVDNASIVNEIRKTNGLLDKLIDTLSNSDYGSSVSLIGA